MKKRIPPNAEKLLKQFGASHPGGERGLRAALEGGGMTISVTPAAPKPKPKPTAQPSAKARDVMRRLGMAHNETNIRVAEQVADEIRRGQLPDFPGGDAA